MDTRNSVLPSFPQAGPVDRVDPHPGQWSPPQPDGSGARQARAFDPAGSTRACAPPAAWLGAHQSHGQLRMGSRGIAES